VTAAHRGRSRRPSSRARSPPDASWRRLRLRQPDRTVKPKEAALIVPELPADVRELKERVARFVEDEVYPLEQRIAATGSIDEAEVDALRRKAREAGFAMLNMPEAHGGIGLSMVGQVALEEESGKATNGLGFAVVDRGPRELLEIATPDQAERFVAPIIRGEYREAWALTEPGAGSDLSGIRARAERDGDDWKLNGEKWFVTSEGRPGFYVVAAVAEGEQTLFIVEPDAPGLEIARTPRFLHDPYLDHHPELVFTDCRVPDANRIPASGDAGAKEWILVERIFIAARCCGAAQRLLDVAADWAKEREAFGSPIADYQGVSFQLADSLTELLAARLLTYHAAHAFDSLSNRKIVHGKVSMAKLYASEMAGRVADRALQILGGRGYMVESPAARHFRELRVDRIWEGTSEIQRLIVAGGLLKRGAAPYLGWE
jgi:alkylation response protein AidB-like acyl-CoA dehydrogenase